MENEPNQSNIEDTELIIDLRTPVELDSIYFFAVCNARNRYYLPSKQNFFAGLLIPYCLIDPGCSTMLIPLSSLNLDEIISKYSSPDFDWKISSSKGTGALKTPTLLVKKYNYAFPLELMTDVLTCNGKIKLDYLRFHVSYEIAKRLEDFPKLNKSSKTKLTIFIKQMERLKTDYPKKDFSAERKHALIGQLILSQFSLVQHRAIFAAIDSQNLGKMKIDEIFENMVMVGDENITNNFEEDEFSDLEDQDQDSDEGSIRRKEFLNDDE